MKLAIPKERLEGETRVAASPETVKKLTALGLEVIVETGAGEHASIADQLYADAGATRSVGLLPRFEVNDATAAIAAPTIR